MNCKLIFKKYLRKENNALLPLSNVYMAGSHSVLMLYKLQSILGLKSITTLEKALV